MQRAFAVLLVVVGLLLIAGGAYFLAGIGLVVLGFYLSGTGSTGRTGEVISAMVAIAGALGALAVVVVFVLQRITALQ